MVSMTTAEIRWFWYHDLPKGMESWFVDGDQHGCLPNNCESSTDSYLYDASQTTLGLKRRGGSGNVEVKALVGSAGHLEAPPFRGSIELWHKWRVPPLELFPSLTVIKRRWQRYFDTSVAPPADVKQINPGNKPEQGCSVELTRLILPDDQVWWTFGLEGYGNPPAVGNYVRNVAALLAARRAPALDESLTCAYPRWLGQLIRS